METRAKINVLFGRMYEDMLSLNMLHQKCDSESQEELRAGLETLQSYLRSRAAAKNRYDGLLGAFLARVGASGTAEALSANNVVASRGEAPSWHTLSSPPHVSTLDFNVISLTGDLSRSARRYYLQELVSKYNNMPDGELLPAAYVNLDKDYNKSCPSATQLPDETCIARVDRQVEATGEKVVFMLPVKIEVHHLAVIDLNKRHIMVLALSEERPVCLACCVAVRFAWYVLSIEEEFLTVWYHHHRLTPRMPPSVYLCWAAQKYLPKNNCDTAETFEERMPAILRQMQLDLALR